eukprot:FR735151.1.p1 GENE.FR735151.1~~FR735151.1.p1  ORF type:complete len:282 (+),score=4.96 FR735151.1:41-847(+)
MAATIGDNLRLAAARDDVDSVRFNLEGGGNPCSRDRCGLTALHYAAWNSNVECVKYLVANHLGVVEENAEHPPMQESSGGSKTPSSKATSPPRASDRTKTKQIRAAERGDGDNSNYSNRVKLRLSCLNVQSHMGQTAMHLAASEGDSGPELIRILRSAGADHSIKDYDGNTPLDLARQHHRDTCIDELQLDPTTEAELIEFRENMNTNYKIIHERRNIRKFARMQGFKLPQRMAETPKELEMPEQYILPYARRPNEVARSVKPMKDLE